MRLDTYMEVALSDADHGYYATRDPFGAEGDFVTAPEISQMFGELIGLSLAQAWIDQNRPAPFALAELGPGRGTLMMDILRATRAVPGFVEAAELHLVETSPTLRAAQSERLTATWHDDVGTLPDLPTLVVANEFFDALPIRQFQRDGEGWREARVILTDDVLTREFGPIVQIESLDHRRDDTRDGDVVELCPALPGVLTPIANRIASKGGAAILIDYGDWRSLGDTLQAVRGHDHVDPFAAPGSADLTAHVDFEAIANAAAPARYTRLAPQGVFLERLGITQRAQKLAAPLSGPALDALIAAHRRLTDPSEMGSLFKVMGIYPPNAPPPAGLEP